jgi:hypothetical protein
MTDKSVPNLNRKIVKAPKRMPMRQLTANGMDEISKKIAAEERDGRAVSNDVIKKRLGIK